VIVLQFERTTHICLCFEQFQSAGSDKVFVQRREFQVFIFLVSIFNAEQRWWLQIFELLLCIGAVSQGVTIVPENHVHSIYAVEE